MTDKETIIICTNSNLKSYILNLQHKQDELRKYLIGICNLLGIDTRQSLLGANCLEFYAVLSSTAENKIKELKEWREANQPTGICETCTVKSVEDMYEYKQVLNEIERFCKDACDSCKKFTPNRQSDISCRFCQATQILNIINKVKEK